MASRRSHICRRRPAGPVVGHRRPAGRLDRRLRFARARPWRVRRAPRPPRGPAGAGTGDHATAAARV